MRFPSVLALVQRAREVLLRFPWTIAAGVTAAVALVVVTADPVDAEWARIAMVAALGLPLTVALTLLAEERGWPRRKRAAVNAAGVVLLGLFYLMWPGPEREHEVIRYLQLSAGLHLLVAFLPFQGQRESGAFWQYNHRLFLAILRAGLFSGVLFVGLMIALGALDQLFGVDVPEALYARLGIVILFVVNTWIFLAAVPRGLARLAGDTSYPTVLKIFAQYILTPLVFTYLLILLAYLIKVVVGGEWPSGWIGWLVTSVAAAGLLGFLLVHPLRDDAGEGWIRTYTRWLFIGLIPSAVMLLVAFWKRILPYGLTEPRLLGILLGIWLLAIAIYYTLRQEAGIRRIPVTLAALLLLTLYGPLSVTALSVRSQSRRLGQLATGPREGKEPGSEASAALRFLLEHGDRGAVASAIPGALPDVDWDSVAVSHQHREKAAERILVVADLTYTWADSDSRERDDQVHLNARSNVATPTAGYDWILDVSASDTRPQLAGSDSVSASFDTASSVAHVTVGTDSLTFDLGRLARELAGKSVLLRNDIPPGDLRLEAVTPRRSGALVVQSLSGRRTSDSLHVGSWEGKLLLGRPK
ncbi:MAG: hypothetical protein QOH59_1781 [Gemmatimonadales bacterium]|jgi:hypothetical protein|nr:hypothetical protein [Gemmatimonadales bacterium]